MGYEVRKSLLGRWEVRFQCANCKSETINPIEDAGTIEPCPSCGVPQRIPGSKAKEELAAARKAEQQIAEARERVRKELEVKQRLAQQSSRRSEKVHVAQQAQAQFESDQQSLRQVAKEDVVIWTTLNRFRTSFGRWIRIGRRMCLFGIVCAIFGLVALVLLKVGGSSHEVAIICLVGGLVVALVGYLMYIQSVFLVVIFSIERNTRTLLNAGTSDEQLQRSAESDSVRAQAIDDLVTGSTILP